MLIIGLVFAGLAAALHVVIFGMESLAWTTPRVRATFGSTVEEAEATKEMAFNQGFYNLFLAIVTTVGIVLVAVGTTDVGAALALAGTGSMAAAAAVLVLRAPSRLSSALKQGVLPLLSFVALVIGVALA